MDRIVETMRDLNLQESWGEVIDVTEFMTDSTGFFNTNGLGAFTQIYDRADGRFRPVYTNESDLKLIRAMSWLLVEKVPMAQAWVNRLLDYTIGTGFDWTIKAEDKRLEKAVQLYVRETLDNSRWSSELERESYVREVADGEFLSELIYDDGQCLMVAREADELTEPAIKGELEDWIGIDFVPSWTFGVLTKQSLPERPIGYHFVRNSAGTDWDYVPAERVCLWKRNVRSRGKRGFSDFYKPHLYLLRADRVLTNTAEGAATQAAIAYIVEHRDGTQRQADNIVKRFAPPTGKVDPLTGLAQRRRRMLPGTRLDVPEGQQYKAGLLGSNNSDIYISVMEAALRLAGSVHAFPEGMLTGSYENNNFASALVAEGPFMQGRMAEQAQRKERKREMLLKIIRQGANKRRFAFVGFDTWEKIEQVLTVEVIPSRIIPLDPLKTAQALAIQKQNGWVSDKTCINELGRDVDTETANGLKVGGAEQQPGAAGQPAGQGKPGESPSDLGNVSNEDGKWLGLSRLQWQRNRKAVADVLTDFANGKTRRSVAKVLLRAIGMPEPDIETMLRDAMDGQIDSLPPENMTEAEKKTLNKPFRTPGGPKKFGVYVKNKKGNVIKLPFGDPKMRIKRDDPGRRKGFRSRHNCQDPGPKWKARYWSCRFWSKPSVTKLLKESFQTGEVPWDGRTFVRESWLLKHNPSLLEVRCPTGKGGGIDNSCKRKNKKASSGKSKIASDYRAWIDENDPQMWQASDWDGSEFGALQIWVGGGAKEINSNPNSDLSKSMKKTVDSIPNAKVETIYRVLNFKTSSEAESYIETVGNGARQAQPFASWTSIDPKSDPEGVAANVSSGDSAFKVILKLQKPSKAKDVSFLYHGSEYDRPGVELLTTQGQEMIATRLTKSGNIFNVDVVESLVESYRGLREEKDGDGDGMVNDGKPSERPVNDSDKPKKTVKNKPAFSAGHEFAEPHTKDQLDRASKVFSAFNEGTALAEAADYQMRGGVLKNGKFTEFTAKTKQSNMNKIIKNLSEMRSNDPEGFEVARQLALADSFGFKDYKSMPDTLKVWRGHDSDEQLSTRGVNVTNKKEIADDFGSSGVVSEYEVNKKDILFPLANSAFDEGELIIEKPTKVLKKTKEEVSDYEQKRRKVKAISPGATLKFKNGQTGVLKAHGVGLSMVVHLDNDMWNYAVGPEEIDL